MSEEEATWNLVRILLIASIKLYYSKYADIIKGFKLLLKENEIIHAHE